MRDSAKTKAQLTEELAALRARVKEFEQAEPERKRAGDALRQERDRAQNYLDIAGVILVAIDAEQRTVLINKKGCEILRCKEDEIVGRNWFDVFIPERERDRVRTAYARLMAGEIGLTEYFENPVRTRTGEERIIAWRNTILRHETGKTIGTLSSGEDITERKRAEKQLQESQQMLQLVLDNVPQRIFWKDRDSVYLGGNKNFARDAGVEQPEDLGGKTDYDLPWKKEQADFYRQCDRRVMDTDMPEYHIIEPGLRADGTQIWVETNKVPLHDAAGNVAGILGTYEDITERKRSEEELAKYRGHLEELVERRTAELETSQERLRQAERLASVGTLAAGIAHQINNPVGGILLAAQNAQEAKGRPSAHGFLDKCLSDIVDNARRCGEIIKGILQFARPEEAEKSPSDLNAIVQRCVRLTAAYVQERGGAVELELADTLAEVSVSPLGMEQVFVNLIRNAVQSRVSGVRVAIRTEQTPQSVRVIVQDGGLGMAEEQARRIFDPFFTTRREHGGIGLGLSIVHGIITGHGGTIDVKSRPGCGTTFTIDLPLAPAAAEGRHVEGTDR